MACPCGTCPACKRREYDRRWRDKNRDKERERYRADHAKHHAERLLKAAERRAAAPWINRTSATVSRAVKKGILERGPCELADEDCRGDVQAHHDDYAKPLEVRWFCRRHHQRLHVARKEVS